MAKVIAIILALSLIAEPWEGGDAHTVPADCLRGLFGGAAMTRRTFLRLRVTGCIPDRSEIDSTLEIDTK